MSLGITDVNSNSTGEESQSCVHTDSKMSHECQYDNIRETFHEELDTEDQNHDAFDHGSYGWIVCTACVVGLMMYPLGLSYGLFNIVLLEQFEKSQAETALVGSVCYGMTAGMGVLSGVLANRIGHRMTCIIGSLLTTCGFLISAFTPVFGLLYFSYGILVGTGVCMMSVTCSVMVNFYFLKYRNLATGFVSSGAGIGSLILPLVIEHFIEELSWRGAMLIMAGISLQGCVIGALLKPNGRLKSVEPNRKVDKLLDSTSCRKWSFYLLFVFFVIQGINFTMFFNISPHRVVIYGFSLELAALLLCITGIASTISRIISGIVFHFCKLDHAIAFFVVYTSLGIVHLVLALQQSKFWVLVLVYIQYGVFFGLSSYTHPLYILAVFGLDRLNGAYGILWAGEGIGGLVGPSLAGVIYDNTSSYQVAFYLTSGLTFLGAAIHIPIHCYLRRKRTHLILACDCRR